ncbi:MAG: class I SAM-dependent methyltransferase [Candidatus Woesearchaeota archaeon]
MLSEMRSDQFSLLAEKYRSLDESHYAKKGMLIPTVLRLIGDARGKSFLDVGCGYGLVSRMLMDAGAGRVVGIDGSEEMISLAQAIEKDTPSGVEYLLCKAEDLPLLGGGGFDYALSVLFFNYVDNRHKMGQIFFNVHCNLKTGGKFISFQNHMQDAGFKGKKVCNVSYRRGGLNPDGGRCYSFTRTSPESEITLDFIDWTQNDYMSDESTSRLFSFRWHHPIVSQEAMDFMGPEFWADYLKAGVFRGFEATARERTGD